jgi:guanylate kinase
MNNFIKPSGNVIVISAPSGAGKSTICKTVIENARNITSSISYTTRQPRKNEKNGREYFFITEAQFKEMIRKKHFVEWAKVHGNYYGTSKVLLEKILTSGKNALLEIDVHGGINIKKQYPNACMIFVMTSDFKTLKDRLVARNEDCEEEMHVRLSNAKKELKYISKYEYLIINEKLKDAAFAVKTIIKSLEYKILKK